MSDTAIRWGKNDLLAPDAFNASVTQASSHGGGNNGANVAKDPSDPRYFTFLSDAFPHAANETTDGKNALAAVAYLSAWRR